jgi:2-keto-4-pentenoate hydratase/2-oxohepta-3-ene-1,7-dioic acid hydratase in catechol pathway
LVTFIADDKASVGALIEDHIVDLVSGYFITQGTKAPFNDMISFLKGGEEALKAAEGIIKFAAENIKEEKGRIEIIYLQDQVKIKAPIPNPQKIIALGLNYMDHCKEQGLTPPDRPIIFAKYPSAIIGPGEPITWPPNLTSQVDYEAELAFVVGKVARNVPPDEAFDYIAGYTILNDVTARDIQFADKQWVRGKSLDTFCPMGPCLVTKDQIKDPHDLNITCYVNDKVMQESNTKHLIFDIPYLLSFLSQSFTLIPGDIISTGTPGGVGVFRNPKVFLKPGDEVKITVEGIGTLYNPVK